VLEQEEFLTVPRGFSCPSKQAAFPPCFFNPSRLSFLFLPPLPPPPSQPFYYGWRTFDFIFARGFTTRSYFQTRSRFLSRFLCLPRNMPARTRHLYNQRRVHYDEREDEQREHCAGGGKRRGRRKEIYFYDRDGDVLFLHDRIFLFSREGRVPGRKTRGREGKGGREDKKSELKHDLYESVDTHGKLYARMQGGGQPRAIWYSSRIRMLLVDARNSLKISPCRAVG